MLAYLLAFSLTVWPPHGMHRMREMIAVAVDIVSTDATPEEGLVLENIAALESGFERGARGTHGELGAWQVMPPSANGYGASEALRRLRAQGIQGYAGCSKPCPLTVARRTDPAKLYRMAFDPP